MAGYLPQLGDLVFVRVILHVFQKSPQLIQEEKLAGKKNVLRNGAN
jgi:hypothetical protein